MPAIVGAVHALLYSWGFVLVFTVFYEIDFLTYLIADVYWEIALVICAFVTIFAFLPKLVDVINHVYKRPSKNEKESNQ